MTRKLLCALAAAALLGACEARFGNDAGEVADNATAAGRAEEGRLTFEANGFNMSIDIPDFVDANARTDAHGGIIYPGSDLSGMHVQGRGESRDGHPRGEVELRFTHADAPERVAAWYRDPARAADLTVSSATRQGDAFLISGTVKEDNERFTLTIAPRAGGGSDTRLVLADSN